MSTGWKLPAAFVGAIFATVMATGFLLPEEMPQQKAPVVQVERWITPYDKLPPNSSACYLVWKEYAGPYSAVSMGTVSQTHYGEAMEYNPKTGAVTRERLAGCTYMTSRYGNEVVMIMDGVNVDTDGATRYVWHVDSSGKTVVEMAGSYGH
ncbi:hypothetical protein [Pseudomonas oryzihabitans]|uniref:hypothetical protein n=1 Tax=Pseudomonas oryzihabitans TaxID=47885 RepID=UPI00363E5DD2